MLGFCQMDRHKFLPTLLVVAALAGCSTDDKAAAPSATTADAVGTTSTPSTAVGTVATTDPTNGSSGLRGIRYCEVLLLHPGATGIMADVYNTMGHSDCPQDAWEQLDTTAIAAENGVPAAVLNGPRYWTLDHIDSTMQLTAPVATFGTIEMFLAATVDVGQPDDQTPYTAHGVQRVTTFVFDADTKIYQLTDPDGTHYVMQSYSQQVDPSLNESRLAQLGSVLQLPAGWTYDVITLDDRLEVYDSEGVAYVLQDEFKNSYQRVDPPQV